MSKPRFFETTPLRDMTPQEFEAVCDGCGRCCVHKFEDAEDGSIVYTDVACYLLDTQTCRCADYAHRTERVSACIQMTPEDLSALAFLPDSCAYRRLDEGRGLASWHPLLSGTSESVIASGVSMAGQLVSETHIHPDEISTRLRHDIICSKQKK